VGLVTLTNGSLTLSSQRFNNLAAYLTGLGLLSTNIAWWTGCKILSSFIASLTSLSIFDGKNSQGQWVLGIRDYYNEDSGILNDYSLSFCVTQAVLSSNVNDINYIELYPNPVENTLFIKTHNQNLSYSLYDLKGRKIYSTNEKIIPMENLSAGIYVLRIVSDNHTSIKRIIKK